MNKIDQYFDNYNRIFQLDFERVRQSYSDSDVKGANNEQILADFLEKHLQSGQSIITGAQIIDSQGNASKETDVCINNIYQPFASSPGHLVIAEGIDCVIQVKALLDKQELNRAFSNCQSVKRLQRQRHPCHDKVLAFPDDIPSLVDCIPYIVFAFQTTAVRPETVHKWIVNLGTQYNFDVQPDAIYILNFESSKTGKMLFSFFKHLHGKKGVGALYDDQMRKYAEGWTRIDTTQNRTLIEMMRFLAGLPKIERGIPPLNHYFSDLLEVENMIEESVVS